ncbi:pyruvate kinase [Cupriavidus basilensis]
MIAAGVDVVLAELLARYRAGPYRPRPARARGRRRACGREVAIMADLQGPKIRVGKFENGKVTLKPGDPFVLDASCQLGNEQRVGLDYQDLPRDVGPGDVLLLNDGLIVLVVDRVLGERDLHHRAHRRRPVQQQGHQPPGRWAVGTWR